MNKSLANTDQILAETTVVVRNVGERTTQWCEMGLQSIFSSDQIFMVEEVPMHRAIERTFEIALDENREWTLEIDADLLVYDDGLIKMLQNASGLPTDYFFHFGMVFDKLSNGFRSAGNKLLRTEHIKEAISLIPQAKREIRPDTFIRKSMVANGKHYYRHVLLTGLHDFEQSYSDLYRKGYLQGLKNRGKVKRFVDSWPKDWEQDLDYLAIFGGIEDGLKHEGPFQLSPSFLSDHYSQWKKRSIIKEEKPPLSIHMLDLDHFIRTHINQSIVEDFQISCLQEKGHYHVRSKKGLLYTLMKLMSRIRRKLRRIIKHEKP